MPDSAVAESRNESCSSLTGSSTTCMITIHKYTDLVGQLGVPKDPTNLRMSDEVAANSPEKAEGSLIGLLHESRECLASLSEIGPILC